MIKLEFTGTASFGDDYIVEDLNPDNTATIPNGQQDLFINIDPVPDTRYEGNETITITVAQSPDGSYTPGTPSSQTLTILDDDTQQAPAQGWQVTDLGTIGGTGAEGFAINTVSIGNGQFRGQVTGFQLNSQTPAYKGFFWDNGSYAFRNYPSNWPLNQGDGGFYSQGWGLNDAGTVVGTCTFYNTSTSYHSWATYWNSSSSTPILLPLLATESGLDNVAYGISQRDYINDTGGIIVGSQRNFIGKAHAAIWVPQADETYPATSVADLGDIGDGSRNSYAYSINQLGEVVGKSQTGSTTVYHAFRTRFANGIPFGLDASLDDMGTGTFSDSNTSEANSINDLGELVGASQFPGNVYHAAYKSPDTLKNFGWYRLGVLGEGTANAGTQSIARGINNNGLIVGKSQVKVNGVMVWHGFAISNQGNPGSQPLLDLNYNAYVWVGTGWYTAALYGWVIQTAEKVNNGNWIVGYGTLNGATHAFVLSPR